MLYRKILAFTTAAFLFTACAKDEKFPKIDTHVAGAIDVASSADGKYFYVLNSDFDRTYNSGSILVISEDGEKVGAVQTPRLGRSLTLAGTDLIVTFDKAEDDEHYEVHLYDLSKDPVKPELAAVWTDRQKELRLDCSPISASAREGYQHFVVTCIGGRMFVGTFKTPRSASELKPIRDYSKNGRTRRALYIDPQRELLFAFPTDLGEQKNTDFLTKDEKSYDPKTGKATDIPNEIPDEYEDNKFRRKNSGVYRSRYQYLLVDLAAERAAGFPFRYLDDEDDKVVPDEQRWIYFTLANSDKTSSDTEAQITNMNEKHYRTNFWTAQPNPLDASSFYLSHRGKKSKASRFANNIVKVTIGYKKKEGDTSKTLTLQYERVYGFGNELDVKNHFPGDFKVQIVNNQLTLVVNHFKDLVNFRKDSAFSIGAKVLDGPESSSEIKSTNQSSSYYQVAVNERGRILTCSFYSNAVIPLELEPGTAINLGWGEIKRIQ